MSFLDVQIICEDETFTTYASRKLTFSGVYTHFDNFLPFSYKLGTFNILAFRCFQICSIWTNLHIELVYLK